MATQYAKEQYDACIAEIKNLGSIIPIGSLTYSPYYWITDLLSTNRPSDLDFEVVLDPNTLSQISSLSFWSDPEDYQRFCQKFETVYKAGQADFGTYRAKINSGLFVDCHFVPRPTLEKICGIDLNDLAESAVLHEFRLHPKVKDHVYRQRQFDGSVQAFEGQVIFDGLDQQEGIIFEVPHVLLDTKTNHIALGYVFDKYLAVCNQPIINDKEGFVGDQLDKLSKTIVARYITEHTGNSDASITKALIASDRMNPHYIKELQQYFQELA